MNDESPIALSWRGYEHIHDHKTTEWYTAISIIAMALAVTAVIFGNVLLAIFIIIAAGSIMVHASHEAPISDFEVNQRGVLIGKTLYPYKTLESFGINDESASAKLIIKSRKLLMPFIIIPIDEDDGEALRSFLSRYLPEEHLDEPLSEQIMEYLGF